MSTILKTLKKLEEEKSILDQKLDLKGMALKEEVTYSKVLENERLRFLIAAMVTIIFIFGGIVFYYWVTNNQTTSQPKHVLNQIQQKPLPKSSPKLRTFEGISMALIPGNKKETKVKPEQDFAFPDQKTTKLPFTPKPISKEVPTLEISNDLEEIENLIQSTTTLSKNDLTTTVTKLNGYIPNVKVMGIIFFDEGSSSNHIIVTTPSNSNLKLRVGDPVQNAVLKSIHPSSVIFLHQNQLIEMSIGQ